MKEFTLHELRFPIGEFVPPSQYSPKLIEKWTDEIDLLPKQLIEETMHLSDEQLDTPYRPEGWTLRQVVHHIADSHINSFVRFKLALTEDNPTIKPYWEERWAKLPDYAMPIHSSLMLITSLHARWVHLIECFSSDDLLRTYYHPESERNFSLRYAIALYAWHGKHHLAQIQSLKKRMGW